MQHKICFARHWHLEWRYSDYNCLSFEDMRDLWINKYPYSINISDIPHDVGSFWKSDLCYTSFQNRAIETANSLWFSLPRKVVFLDEIHFDLFVLMTAEEYNNKWWLSFIRTALWQAFFGRRTWIESPESVMGRIQSFIAEISQLNEQNIMAISHWFYLQMVKCFFLKWVDFTKISYDEFLNLDIKPIGYLENFEVLI